MMDRTVGEELPVLDQTCCRDYQSRSFGEMDIKNHGGRHGYQPGFFLNLIFLGVNSGEYFQQL